VADAALLPLPNSCIDLAISMEVLQHLDNAAIGLDEVARVLSPNGLLIVSFPFTYAECDVVDFHRWTLKGMEYELKARGFEVLLARRRGGVFFVLASMLHWGAQHVIPGARRSWRAPSTPLAVLRSGLVQLLALPTAALGWLALGIDSVVPVSGIYVGGLIIARRLKNADAF